jgi:hypothetical protein
MAKYGQTPADFIFSDDDDDEDEIDIQDSIGERFPTHDTANAHYATITERKQLPSLKIKI